MTKTFTSASANKYLRTLADEKEHLLVQEREVSTYTRAVDEREEPPAYSYEDTRAQVAAIDEQTLRLRHALHAFNATAVLPGSGLTIDEALIRLAQLSNLKATLSVMRDQRDRERLPMGYGRANIIEYRYTNYDKARVADDYAAVVEQISALQLEIDLANQTQTFEVEL